MNLFTNLNKLTGFVNKLMVTKREILGEERDKLGVQD